MTPQAAFRLAVLVRDAQRDGGSFGPPKPRNEIPSFRGACGACPAVLNGVINREVAVCASPH